MCVVLWLGQSSVVVAVLIVYPDFFSRFVVVIPNGPCFLCMQQPFGAAATAVFLSLELLLVLCFLFHFIVCLCLCLISAYSFSGNVQNSACSKTNWSTKYIILDVFFLLLSFGLSFHLHAIRFHSRFALRLHCNENIREITAMWAPIFDSFSRNELVLSLALLICPVFLFVCLCCSAWTRVNFPQHTLSRKPKLTTNKRPIRFSFATNRMQNYAWIAVGIRCSY